MMRLPWHGRCVPHAVLDILRGCNCKCRYCYNQPIQTTCKDMEELRAELAVIRKSRAVRTITLSGGEPLLHPNLERIVSWLHGEEKLTVSILTNGILFDEARAAALHRAGCAMVTLHIQEGQRRPDLGEGCIDEFRREKGHIARAHGLFPALVSTITAEDVDEFRALGLFLREAPEFEYALVTLARDFSAIDVWVRQEDVPCEPMLSALADVGFRPACFVGGRHHRDRPRWYIFQSAQAVDAEGRERAWNETRPGLLEWAFLQGLAIFCRRSVHWVRTSSAKLKVRLLLNGLLGGRFSTFLFALRAILRGWTLREKHVVVQLPPHSLGDGRVEICDNCPDATVRNGRLHPLCLNDFKTEVPL